MQANAPLSVLMRMESGRLRRSNGMAHPLAFQVLAQFLVEVFSQPFAVLWPVVAVLGGVAIHLTLEPCAGLGKCSGGMLLSFSRGVSCPDFVESLTVCLKTPGYLPRLAMRASILLEAHM